MPNPLDTILARLSTAEGPDREIDWLVHSNVVNPWQAGREWRKAWHVDVDGTETTGPTSIETYYPDEDKWFPDDMEFVTASVDAAIALAERVLPGYRKALTQGDDLDDTEYQANVWPGMQPYPAHLEAWGDHSSPAIALCLATIRALRAKGGGE